MKLLLKMFLHNNFVSLQFFKHIFGFPGRFPIRISTPGLLPRIIIYDQPPPPPEAEAAGPFLANFLDWKLNLSPYSNNHATLLPFW